MDAGTSQTSDPTVQVLIRQDGTSDTDGAGQFTRFAVHLRWIAGDWRLVTPAWGDWQAAAQPVTDPDPNGYRSYDHPASSSSEGAKGVEQP
jgi:hypothetical protein